MELVILTGLSGSGKSSVLNFMEDIGAFCCDNMPPKLLPTFVDLLVKSREKRDRVAIGIDIRLGISFQDLFKSLDELKQKGVSYKIIFVDASTDMLIRRYKATRRKHPLADKYGSLIECINAEHEILRPARQISDYVIDTSYLDLSQCREKIHDIFRVDPKKAMRIRCMSFGFKHGIPADADLVFDVRCLPNPYYEPELREKTGLDEPVKRFILSHDEATGLVPKLFDLLDYLFPLYRKEGKSELVIAIGCTGGHHRSVLFVELVREHLQNKDFLLSVNHRDILK